jgi:hypothetical protein
LLQPFRLCAENLPDRLISQQRSNAHSMCDNPYEIGSFPDEWRCLGVLDSWMLRKCESLWVHSNPRFEETWHQRHCGHHRIYLPWHKKTYQTIHSEITWNNPLLFVSCDYIFHLTWHIWEALAVGIFSEAANDNSFWRVKAHTEDDWTNWHSTSGYP